MTSSNNYNSNNFILGVDPKKKNQSSNMTPSESLIDHLKRIEKESNDTIKNNNADILTKKSLNSVVNELINKLETDVITLNEQIKNYNSEKKAIIELDNKEMERLKDIIVKMYLLVITINKSIELKHNNRTSLLEKLRKTIQSNKGFLSNIDEIMSNKLKKSNNLYKNKKDFKMSNMIEPVKKIPENIKNTPPNNVSSLNTFYTNLKKTTQNNSGNIQQRTNEHVNKHDVNNNTVNNNHINNQKKINNTVNNNHINNQKKINNTVNNNNVNNQKKINNPVNNNHVNNQKKINNTVNNNLLNKNHINYQQKINGQRNQNHINNQHYNKEHNEEHNEENIQNSSNNREHNEEENNSNQSVIFSNVNPNISSSERYSSINPNIISNEEMNSKKNKKIETKINSIKTTQVNAKQGLNNYFL